MGEVGSLRGNKGPRVFGSILKVGLINPNSRVIPLLTLKEAIEHCHTWVFIERRRKTGDKINLLTHTTMVEFDDYQHLIDAKSTRHRGWVFHLCTAKMYKAKHQRKNKQLQLLLMEEKEHEKDGRSERGKVHEQKMRVPKINEELSQLATLEDRQLKPKGKANCNVPFPWIKHGNFQRSRDAKSIFCHVEIFGANQKKA